MNIKDYCCFNKLITSAFIVLCTLFAGNLSAIFNGCTEPIPGPGADYDGCDILQETFSNLNQPSSTWFQTDIGLSAYVGGNYQNAIFDQARIGATVFEKSADFSNSSFDVVKFNDVDFTNVNLSGANFTSADFDDVSFLESSLVNANFSGSFFRDLSITQQVNASFKTLDATSAIFDGTEIGAVVISQSTFDDVSFLNATIVDSLTFDGVKLFGANLNGLDSSKIIVNNLSGDNTVVDCQTIFSDGSQVLSQAELNALGAPFSSMVYVSTLACNDADGDGVLDQSDNCPNTANPGQADNDGDGDGDACDPDDDNDGVLDSNDNCQFTVNPGQSDLDGDGQGDICDGDQDGDGIVNDIDNCPNTPNPDQSDLDGDGLGDVCDPDIDNDGIANGDDNCELSPNPGQADLDGDGIGDVCDADKDGDGVDNDQDNCALTPNPGQDDNDQDGNGDACDLDDDNDGIADSEDNCPLDPNPDQADNDQDGIGDACDLFTDQDGDGVEDSQDNCPATANPSQNDLDGDGEGDVCDSDIDGDGTPNDFDICPGTELGSISDPNTGCTIEQFCPCDGPPGSTDPWRNHGKYVSCVAKTANSFVKLGLITESEKEGIVSNAANSSCGKKK